MPIQPLDRHIVLEATEREFESQAVLNPATYKEDGLVHLFYRAVRPGNYSSIGYAVLKDDVVIYRSPEPILAPERASEQHGLEDPRIVKIHDTFYLFYTVYDGTDAQVAYAVASELPHFTYKGIFSPPFSYSEIEKLCAMKEVDGYLCRYAAIDRPPECFLWDKDAFFFPEYIHGKLILVHRIQPTIQLLYFNDPEKFDKKHWLRYLSELESHTLMDQRYWFESGYIGGGIPPIRTADGWLFIYHAVEETASGKTYRAAAALLDLDRPREVIGRLDYPLFSPDLEWEKEGDVANVVFPTGAVVEGDIVRIYYGAADKRIGVITFRLSELIHELHNSPEGRAHARAISRKTPEAVGV